MEEEPLNIISYNEQLLTIISESTVSNNIKERCLSNLSPTVILKLSISHGEEGLCMEWPSSALLI